MQITAPRSRAAGAAASRIASARLRGPSASGSSAARCAPVNTTGVAAVWARSTRYADSSIVSVPWVTTTPSTPGSAAASTTRRVRCTTSARLRLKLPIRKTSSTSTRTPRSPLGSVATSSAPESCAVTPAAPRREAIVPPVVRTRTVGTGTPDDGGSRAGSAHHRTGLTRRPLAVVTVLRAAKPRPDRSPQLGQPDPDQRREQEARLLGATRQRRSGNRPSRAGRLQPDSIDGRWRLRRRSISQDHGVP